MKDNYYDEHKKFQFGTNPMEMSSFEKSLVAKEVAERNMATRKYVSGIQGKDGGCYVHAKIPEADLPLAGRD